MNENLIKVDNLIDILNSLGKGLRLYDKFLRITGLVKIEPFYIQNGCDEELSKYFDRNFPATNIYSSKLNLFLVIDDSLKLIIYDDVNGKFDRMLILTDSVYYEDKKLVLTKHLV
jgi:hypothetical protein